MKRTEKKEQISTYVDKDLEAFISYQCSALGLSESQYLRCLISNARNEYRKTLVKDAHVYRTQA